jgi:hypothetical protein
MKTASRIALATALCGLASVLLSAGCADQEPSPPPVAVVTYPPPYYFWDGYEYAAWFGDGYYWWGPGGVWIICDPVRVQRVTVWVNAHPEWHRPTAPPPQFRTPPPNAPPPTRGPAHRRDHDRDD